MVLAVAPAFDLEALYRAYPRKEGKRGGLEKLKKIIKTQADFDRFALSVENYKRVLASRGKGLEFTLLFSTFCNGRFEDYVEEIEASGNQALAEKIMRGEL